jgi:pyrroline-5-carboxylate reductase
LGEIFDEVKKRRTKPLFVSMAAGVKIEKIKESLGDDTPIIRIMPNTPVSVGEGMILYCASDDVTEEQKANFLEICKCCGRLDEISESAIDAASAVSGCGPAFVYMLHQTYGKINPKANFFL